MNGVNPPMITPFMEDEQVDDDGLKKLISFLKGNVEGIFITGSYGSGAPRKLADYDHKGKLKEVKKLPDGVD